MTSPLIIVVSTQQLMFHSPSLDPSSSFISSLKSVHSFKLPLQLSLAFSPLVLFLPSLIMSKDLNRVTMFWVGFVRFLRAYLTIPIAVARIGRSPLPQARHYHQANMDGSQRCIDREGTNLTPTPSAVQGDRIGHPERRQGGLYSPGWRCVAGHSSCSSSLSRPHC